ncbi:hypothetical protein KC19_4G192600 [Ceratodon purpureus]|uniref:alanine--glyoxylate transaminase n=1 Tax=Ceratodon purpureus TaxID=3225 RepID=A0A8T0IDZ5_CERPU|nr:hypothetical protein KC19_4G192600 [Ceratodon purpureus]
MGGSVVAGGRTLLLPKCVSMLSWYRRGLSLAADASNELVQPEGGVPHMPPFDFTTQPYEEIQLAKRKNLLNPALFLYYKKHLNIVEGKMQYLFDESGRRCLDAFAGIVTMSLGHGHSAVLDAVVKQTKLLQHTIVNYAEALAQRMPGNLKGFGVHHALNPDPYRGLLVPMATPMISPTFLSLLYLAALLGFFIRLSRSLPTHSVSYTLRTHICFFKDVDQSGQDSAMLAGEAVELAPRIYLPAAYEIVRKAGACALQMKFRQVLVVTDTNFWGFQNQGVTPDIVTLAKVSNILILMKMFD